MLILNEGITVFTLVMMSGSHDQVNMWFTDVDLEVNLILSVQLYTVILFLDLTNYFKKSHQVKVSHWMWSFHPFWGTFFSQIWFILYLIQVKHLIKQYSERRSSSHSSDKIDRMFLAYGWKLRSSYSVNGCDGDAATEAALEDGQDRLLGGCIAPCSVWTAPDALNSRHASMLPMAQCKSSTPQGLVEPTHAERKRSAAWAEQGGQRLCVCVFLERRALLILKRSYKQCNCL